MPAPFGFIYEAACTSLRRALKLLIAQVQREPGFVTIRHDEGAAQHIALSGTRPEGVHERGASGAVQQEFVCSFSVDAFDVGVRVDQQDDAVVDACKGRAGQGINTLWT